jgi:hypothetical protein
MKARSAGIPTWAWGAFFTLLVGCGAGEVPHRVVDRDVTPVQSVRLSGLPPGSRVTIEGKRPADRQVFATKAEGSVELPLSFHEHEHVDNGQVTGDKKPASYLVTVQAPGYLPRAIPLTVPGVADVDVDLEPVPVPALAVRSSVEGDVDAAINRLVSGHCDEAHTLFDGVRQRTPDAVSQRLADAASRCVELTTLGDPPAWAPASFGLTPELAGDPDAAMNALRAVMASEKDDAGTEGLNLLGTLVAAGRLSAAGRVADLVAEPLPANRAALVQRLPVALLAEAKLRSALVAVRQGDTRSAMAFASEARHMESFVGPEVYKRIRAVRVQALRRQASAAEAASPLLARAYWLAVDALEPGANDARGGLARTEAAAGAAVLVRLGIESPHDGGSLATVADLLASALPAHVQVARTPGGEPDAMTMFLVTEPVRTHEVTRENRSTDVVIGTVMKPNPDYELAVNDVQSAEQGLQTAQQSYNELHQQALQNAQNASNAGGVWGAAFAGVAATGEGAGIAMVTEARSTLDEARRKLQQTPQVLPEQVHQQAGYPVVVVKSGAMTRILFRVDGFAQPIEDHEEVTASGSAEQIDAAPEIGVEGSQADVSQLARLTPDTGSALRNIVKRVGDQVRAMELESAWTSFEAFSERGSAESAAEAAVRYLAVAGPSGTHSGEAIEFLVRMLP